MRQLVPGTLEARSRASGALSKVVVFVVTRLPRPLQPAVLVLYVVAGAIVAGIASAGLMALFGRPFQVDPWFFGGLAVSATLAAVAYGLCREFIPLWSWLQPWFLGTVASFVFFLTLCLVADLSYRRPLFTTLDDLRSFAAFVLIFGAALGVAAVLNGRGRHGPA